MRLILSRLFALGLFFALVAAAWIYPVDKALLGVVLAAYCALLWWRPHAWLLIVPALLPVLDLAPWTGWFFLDELDLLLLATCAVGYARLLPGQPRAALPPFFAWSLSLVALSWLISAWIGVVPLSPLDANAFASYSSHYNSLRIAKGLAWTLLSLPLLRRAAGTAPGDLRRLLVPGMLLGLGGACAAVILERKMFPGLTNFASDYRPTGPFSAMHTGGAALDAYLAISFPFVAAWLLGQRSRVELAVGLLLLVAGSYAGLALFSRDIYLAYGLAGAIIGALLLARRARQGRLRAGPVLAVIALLAAAGFALARVFSSGGYRTLACSLVLLLAAFVLAAAPRRWQRVPLIVTGALLLAAATGMLAVVFDKGAYIGFALAATAFGAGLAWIAARGQAALAAAAFPALALGAALVGLHWGGSAAALDAAVVGLLAAIGVAACRLRARAPLHLNRASLTGLLFSAIVLATAIPLSSSYFMGERFSTVGADMDVRLRHWREAIGMMAPGTATSMFGMGLGRYPETYAWNNFHGEQPGTYSFEPNGANLMLRLGAAGYAGGVAEALRMLQRVDIEPGKAYHLAADIRARRGAGMILFGLCARWMLYPEACTRAWLGKPGAAGWTHYDAELKPAGDLSGGLPVQLEFSLQAAGDIAELDNLSLRESGGGPELLQNGDFAQANAHWFFSSDRNHFPWHVKNVLVNTFFEQGWFGLAALALLLLYLGTDLAMRALDGDDLAAVFLAAMAGFMSAGAFDSLFDVPRLTLLFYMLACAALLRPARGHDKCAPAGAAERNSASRPAALNGSAAG